MLNHDTELRGHQIPSNITTLTTISFLRQRERERETQNQKFNRKIMTNCKRKPFPENEKICLSDVHEIHIFFHVTIYGSFLFRSGRSCVEKRKIAPNGCIYL